LIGVKCWLGGFERWPGDVECYKVVLSVEFYELISIGRHFLVLSATQFSTLCLIGKMTIPTSLTVRLN